MSNLLPIKDENPMELATLAQKLMYYEYTKCLEIPINALGNTNSKALILFKDSFIGLEARIGEVNTCSNSFPIIDLGI